MSKDSRKLPEINAASMADIAFLLLIFFLLVTTIDTDKGIIRKLPPIPEGPPPKVDINQRNVFIVLINSADKLLVEGEYMKVGDLKDATKKFILNPNNDPNLSDDPTKAVVSLKNDRGTTYDMYLTVQNELTAAYDEIRDEASRKMYGVGYDELDENDPADKRKIKKIKDMYPMKVSEAEPESVGENTE